jgi:hypothetical protein
MQDMVEGEHCGLSVQSVEDSVQFSVRTCINGGDEDEDYEGVEDRDDG